MTDNSTSLRALVDLRDRTLQKSRIAFGNRMAAIERGSDTGTPELVARWQARFADLEAEASADIVTLAAELPIVQYMVQIKGIGFLLAAKVAAMVDIAKAPTVSSLWRYAGFAVIDGVRERPVKGQKLHYNIRLKTTLGLIGTSFLKCNSPYADLYGEAYEYYIANRPEWGACATCQVENLAECQDPAWHSDPDYRRTRQHGKYLGWRTDHIHRAAMRKPIKMFLGHLWLTWRRLENLPVGDPYIIGWEGHTHYRTPQEFGWPEV